MNKTLQGHLLNNILHKFKKRSEAVEALSGILNIGKDAVYRRLRGDTLLTPDELRLLANKYQISLDALIFGDTDSVFFTFNAFSQTITSVEDYLIGLKDSVAQLTTLPEAKVYYASSEIPFFYYCFFPKLITFKLYVWGRTVWDLAYLRNKPFSFDLIPPQSLDISKELLGYYKKMNTTDLWSLNIFDNTLNQIEYHLNSGVFQKEEDAVELCACLNQLADHMCAMAEVGKKFTPGHESELGMPFNLYHNEMIYTNNTIFVSSPYTRVVFTTFGNPNFLQSSDERLCDFTQEWFQKIIRKSNHISEQAEKDRNRFFNGLKRRVDLTRKRIELALSY